MAKRITNEIIVNQIYHIRGRSVMIDRDLATLYGVPTRRLNEQVKRNFRRFPEDFMFQLTRREMAIWKSQIATSNNVRMGLRKLPYAFTEQGVANAFQCVKQFDYHRSQYCHCPGVHPVARSTAQQ